MTHRTSSPTWWQLIDQRIAASHIGAQLFSLSLHHIDRFFFKISGGRYSIARVLTGLPIVLVTTRGARTGMARQVPLVGFPFDEKIILIASNWGHANYPAWYFNLRACPETEVTQSGCTRKYIAREAAGSEYDEYWKQVVQQYAGYAAYKSRAGSRKIPILVLTPQAQ